MDKGVGWVGCEAIREEKEEVERWWRESMLREIKEGLRAGATSEFETGLRWGGRIRSATMCDTTSSGKD